MMQLYNPRPPQLKNYPKWLLMLLDFKERVPEQLAGPHPKIIKYVKNKIQHGGSNDLL